MKQTTIKETFGFEGICLHTGAYVRVRVLPSEADTGIIFCRTDIEAAPHIKAVASNVTGTSYATSVGKKGVHVSTVEHLLAAFYGMGIDNAKVLLDGPEIPIMDGSSAPFVGLIEDAGIERLASARKYLVVKKPIRFVEGDKEIALLPSEDFSFSVDYSIDFAHPFISSQSFEGPFSPRFFSRELSMARTFGFLKDVEMLKQNGLVRGGSLTNAVIIGEDNILNDGGLRYPDEFVRHKVLDAIGDMSLFGAPLIARLKAHRSGHGLNHRLVQKSLACLDRWEMMEFPAESCPEPSGAFVVNMATA
ncbi:MAG: UDP-3-O-acyl-N-acetylglucosamine deacetylase [Deltaproteobacteria bacterium]|nr:UDP-3-O-acyl-N-acetylglucosamine deacetylase [Deltaproteobacteria bacterium]